LARRREGEHPLEAIPIWQGEIERVIDAKNNRAYAEAVDLIVRVRRAADRGGSRGRLPAVPREAAHDAQAQAQSHEAVRRAELVGV